MRKKQRNPVRELAISQQEMAKIRRAVDRELAGKGAQIRKAGKLYADFTGHADLDIVKAKIPSIPYVLVEIGKIDGLLYTTVRDGVTERYIHRFKAKSRPLFAVSPDGKLLFLLGGAFTFGERGIVDT